MASFPIYYRERKKRRVSHPAFTPRTAQLEYTSQVTRAGNQRAVRPPMTYLRRMDDRGRGTISSF